MNEEIVKPQAVFINKPYKERIDCHKNFNAEIGTDIKTKLKRLSVYVGKSHNCERALWSVISELVNHILSNGGTLEEIGKILQGHTCEQMKVGFKSCCDRIGRILLNEENKKK